MLRGICALLLLTGAAAAQTTDDAAKSPSRYEQALQAQYAAHGTPTPQRPEEAQQIYDAYLKSIGQPPRYSSMNSTGGADAQSPAGGADSQPH